MVIQRWQTLLLLLAAVLMAVINFLPVASLADAANPNSYTAMFTTDAPVLVVIDGLICALLFIGIFLFKNLRLQMRVTILTILLMCVLAVVGGIILYRHSALSGIEWSGAVMLLGCALVLAIGAYRLMLRDRNLLRSADRLR